MSPVKFVKSFVLLITLVSTEVFAQGYIGATAGKTTWRESCTPYASTCLKELGKSNAFKFLGGYDISSHWGVEGSLYNNGTASSGSSYYREELKSNGVDVAAVFRFKFGGSNFGGFVKLGAASDRGEINVYSSYDKKSFRYSKSSVQPVFGIGMTYNFNETLSARFDIDSRRTQVMQNSDGIYATSTNVGLVVHF